MKQISNPYTIQKKRSVEASFTSDSSNNQTKSNSHEQNQSKRSGNSINASSGVGQPAVQNVRREDNEPNQSHGIDSRKRGVDEISSGTASNSLFPLATSDANKQSVDLVQPHVLLVSTKQKGNGLIRFIRNVPYTYTKIVPDYIMGSNRCILFLSLKYHNLHPNYIHRRIAELKNDFDLRVLLCLVDVEDNASILLYLNKLCVVNSLSLLLAWSEEECARYIETFKFRENKETSVIEKKKDMSFMEQISEALSSVRSVNKTDSSQLMLQFGNLKSLVTASMEEIRSCPGIGDKKVMRMFNAFNKPFSASLAAKKREEETHIASIEHDIANIENELIDDDDNNNHNSPESIDQEVSVIEKLNNVESINNSTVKNNPVAEAPGTIEKSPPISS